MVGPSSANPDSTALSVLTVADGTIARWGAVAGYPALQPITWLEDGAIALTVADGPSRGYTWSLYQLRPRGQPKLLGLLGTLLRPVTHVSVAQDLRRVVETRSAMSADVTMWRVAGPDHCP